MEHNTDFTRMIMGIVDGCDMSSELDRRRKFKECVAFADDMIEAGYYTDFLRQAAQLLGQQAQFEALTNTLVKSSGKERVYLNIDEHEGIQLIGNKAGLMYVSRILKGLSQAEKSGEYVYFYNGEPPLPECSIPMAAYLEDDKYFDELEGDEEQAEDEDVPPLPNADVDPYEVAAFFVVSDPPQELCMTPMKLYKVLGVDEAPSEEAFKGLSAGGDMRLMVFVFERDDGILTRMCMNMYDEDIGFVTHSQLEKLQ